MFRQRLLFFRTVLLATDLVLIALAWFFAYHLRLTSGLIPVWKGVPPLHEYIFPLLYLCLFGALSASAWACTAPGVRLRYGTKGGCWRKRPA